MTRLSTLLDEIDSGVVLLPEFQRGYVWNRDQVRGLMRSLYKAYPVGGLLVWETTSEDITVRGAGAGSGTRQLLLDGQQRVTSMYGVVRGTPPPFFEGDKAAFTGLHFNVETESFEFYAPTKMAGDPTWVSVTELFHKGPFEYLTAFPDVEREVLNTYLERLNRIKEIENRNFNSEKITGAGKTVEEVVDIFNKVNSGGTKLSKGDLALAKLCAEWPEARKALRDHLDRWKKAGFRFSLDWLLRNATAVATGRALFSSLAEVSAADFESALGKSVNHVGTFLDAASGRLGLDHDRVLMGRYATPVVTRLLHLNGGGFTDSAHRDKVLYWYVHSALWGRFSGSTETYLQQDYEAVERGGVDALISTLERVRGGQLVVSPDDFSGATRGSRFYPLLYLLTRVAGARDFGSGLELRAELLGKLTSLQVHHIFPKALLRKHGFDRNEINALANFCFLTQDTNIKIGMRDPAEYLPEVEAKHPGVLESQWIPTDPELWRVDRYKDFLAARRELLAASAQSFLEGLRNPAASHDDALLERLQVADEVIDDPRGEQVRSLITELESRGFATPVVDAEIPDPASGAELAVAEAFWPEGLQRGLGSPVVLELDPDEADLPRLEELGYQVFTSVDALLGFVDSESASAAGEASPESQVEYSAHNDAESEFARRMKAVYERGRSEAGYNASYFLSMLSQYGPQETAHRLLASPAISDGFAELWERGRLDLTVEAIVVDPQFSSLFSEHEVALAQRRLAQFGYAPSPGTERSSATRSTVNNPDLRARFRGCLLGGAVGDALGAPVEFLDRNSILARFGPNGITDYAPAYGRLGAITDDTQMTLFTAEGLIRSWVRGSTKGITTEEGVTAHAYLRWLLTQGERPNNKIALMDQEEKGWLFDHAALHQRRAPGNTCLSALRDMQGLGEPARNTSKGCGGVMRAAPAGLYVARASSGDDLQAAFELGTRLSALTHGHPTGFLAGGVLAALVFSLARELTLPEALREAKSVLIRKSDHEEVLNSLSLAETLSESTTPPHEAISQLGAGWVAEEALGIAVYCALAAGDFRQGILLAVNHSGDSDSTGAITGNLLGTMHGVDCIPPEWLEPLELSDVIQEVANDLFGFPDWRIDGYSFDDAAQRIWNKYPGF